MGGAPERQALPAPRRPADRSSAARRGVPLGGLRRAAHVAVGVLCVLALDGTPALAVPTAVNVRIEGRSRTLFEGPVLSEGHEITARSEAESHQCDGINPNDPQNTAPGPTPTAAGFDAMTIVGGSFDGRWNASYDDFFVTEWDGEREAEGNSWSVLVNGTLLSVGGCQYELQEGAQVLWSYGPSKPMLALYPAGAEGAPPLTAVAAVGVPLDLEVLSHKAASGTPPTKPGRSGFGPSAGATIVPVATEPDGAETPLTEQPLATSSEQGDAAVTFTAPGWHRLMAVAAGALRSNRIDVCVCAPGAAGCGPVPIEDVTRAPGVVPSQPEAGCGASPGSSPPGQQGSPPSAGAGAGGGAKNQSRSAPVVLRFEGRALEAHGALWRGLRYHGRWRRRSDPEALQGVLEVGAARASVTSTLGPGRPVLALDAESAAARVELREPGSRRVVLLRPRRAGAGPLLVVLAAMRRSGPVTLRVLHGEVGLDAVADAPTRR